MPGGETVVFAWIVWPSREVRVSGMQAAMQDPRIDPAELPVPFDTNRIIHGGFRVALDE